MYCKNYFLRRPYLLVYGLLLFTLRADTHHSRIIQCQHRILPLRFLPICRPKLLLLTYTSVSTEDDQDTHFRLVIRVNCGQLLWRD
ncbi:DUF905 family protein [Serratia fonticola]|uniref:DUF905 family protein n=1 Tax=Serratia fonticola TaxID=47917 RepID=A0ABY9PQV0_SERFO|nr:DUF905 family protein [Serratia fonticola]WMT14909.1 DUF905 family protein [Serratia fonticola]